MSFNNIILCSLVLLVAGCATTAPSSQTETGSKQHKTHNQNEVNKDIATYALAMADIKVGKLDKASALLKELTEKHPDLAGPWANLALIDVKQNNLSKASTDLQKAIKRDPAMPQAYNLKGYIDKQQGKITQAIKDYQQAIAKKPDYALAHYNLALLYDVYLQDVPKAVDNYKRYLTLTNYQDKRTAEWVKELQNSMKGGKP